MRVKPFVTIPTSANLAIIVFCLVGIISPCKATRDMSTIARDAENKNHDGGQGANGQLQKATSCVEEVIESKFGEIVDGSPQGYALDWLVGDIGDNDCDNEEKIVQRYVLAAIYFGNIGDRWKKKRNWLGDIDECKWEGVYCNDDEVVTYLALSYNKLKGTIMADEMNALGSLHSLRLGGNRLKGTIPHMTGLVHLKVLELDHNKLTGQITDQFEGLTRLETLKLSNNALTGTIPDMSGIVNLRSLSLGENRLIGQITDQFEGLIGLYSINFSSNALTGTIPLSALTNLSWINLSRNKLGGGLDPKLFELRRLQYLWLDHNKLTGPIPDNFGGSTTLRDLWLNCNLLTGTIPGITGDTTLQNIRDLHLQKNKMTGPVPDTLCALMNGTPFRFSIYADCGPPKNPQNECERSRLCCSRCFRGKGVP